MILFLSDVTLFDPCSGAEQVLYQEAIGLARYGYKVSAITRTNQKNGKTIEAKRQKGIQELRYSANTKNPFHFIWQVLTRPKFIWDTAIDQNSLDIIICHQPFTMFALFMNRRLIRTPILYLFISPSHQEYLIMNQSQKWPIKNINSRLRKFIEKVCLKKADKIMYLSQYMKQKAIKVHGVNKKDLIYNPAGVDLERFKPSECREKIKNELFLPVDKIHLFTVRNLENRMGLDNLIKAINFLKKHSIEVFLVIGGEGPEKYKLQKLIKRLNLENTIILTGFIPDADLPRYYNAADYFILPTRELEGFGLVTIESMACGTPVLGTPVGATTEILSRFNPRMLFNNSTPESIAEGIQLILNKYPINAEEYRDLRIKCREHVKKKYSWQRHHERLKSIITDVSNDKNSTIRNHFG